MCKPAKFSVRKFSCALVILSYLCSISDANYWWTQIWNGVQGITCNAAGRVTNFYIDSSTNFKLKVKAGVTNAAGSIGSLTELTHLDFFNAVQFAYAHPIPPQFGNLVKLVSLTMYQTQFTGAIPTELGKLVKLGDMLLAGNRFTGGIPDSFANLKLLTRLILSDNKLKTIGSQRITLLKNLQTLDLSNNLLSGSIPKWLGKLTISDIIELSQNAFTGPIPGELCNIRGLQRISIHDTKVTAIPPQIRNCAALTELVLSNNKIQGKLPAELGNCFNLFRLDVSGNVLSGTLPESLGGLRNLQDFNIANNKFTGQIPASYGPFQDNEFVSFTDLSRNMLSGNLIGKLPNLLPLPKNCLQAQDCSQNSRLSQA